MGGRLCKKECTGADNIAGVIAMRGSDWELVKGAECESNELLLFFWQALTGKTAKGFDDVGVLLCSKLIIVDRQQWSAFHRTNDQTN